MDDTICFLKAFFPEEIPAGEVRMTSSVYDPTDPEPISKPVEMLLKKPLHFSFFFLS